MPAGYPAVTARCCRSARRAAGFGSGGAVSPGRRFRQFLPAAATPRRRSTPCILAAELARSGDGSRRLRVLRTGMPAHRPHAAGCVTGDRQSQPASVHAGGARSRYTPRLRPGGSRWPARRPRQTPGCAEPTGAPPRPAAVASQAAARADQAMPGQTAVLGQLDSPVPTGWPATRRPSLR